MSNPTPDEIKNMIANASVALVRATGETELVIAFDSPLGEMKIQIENKNEIPDNVIIHDFAS